MKTEQAYWEQVHSGGIRMRLPRPVDIGTINTMRLLRRHVPAGARVLEIGFAPGKMLAWVAARLGARVSGLDYAAAGVATAHRLFDTLGIPADLRCEDVFAHSFTPGSFDVVYSLGVIEHFDDPREIVRRHMELLAPGGVAIIAIPNYGGLYGRLQRRFDPENLAIHNTSIMSLATLAALVPVTPGLDVRSFPWGRMAASNVSWHRVMPRPLAFAWTMAFSVAGMLQPVDVAALSPYLVLRICRT